MAEPGFKVFRVSGPAPGPRVLLLAGVHGDEGQGPAALERLAAELGAGRPRLERGEAVLVPRVNAGALAAGAHGLDENLNRIVRRHERPATREQALANALLPLLEEADAVLDLHGTPAPTEPFAFLDDESDAVRAWAGALGAASLVAGWPALYAGEGTTTTTERAQILGKPALTVEAGRNDDPAAADFARECALRTLAHFGLVAPLPAPPRPPRLLRLTRVVRREGPGAFARPWKNFDAVRAGDLLARLESGAELRATEDAVIVMPFEAAETGGEWLYLAVPA
jgi:predicted deacylase